MYACLIETGYGDAVIGFRGSESYNAEQIIKDWGLADLALADSSITMQQKDASSFTRYCFEEYGEKYGSFTTIGHSLGGNLAAYAMITAPAGMDMDECYNVDGPGFSDEFYVAHAGEVQREASKITHLRFSWVGNLLFPVPGSKIINAKVKDRHDPEFEYYRKTPIEELDRELWKHSVMNLELDPYGNLQEGQRGGFEYFVSELTKRYETNGMRGILSMTLSGSNDWMGRVISEVLITVGTINIGKLPTEYIVDCIYSPASFAAAAVDRIGRYIDDVLDGIKAWSENFYRNVILPEVSGEFSVSFAGLEDLREQLSSAASRVYAIAAEAEGHKNRIFEASGAFGYVCNDLGKTCAAIEADAVHLQGLADAVGEARGIYEGRDKEIAELFV